MTDENTAAPSALIPAAKVAACCAQCVYVRVFRANPIDIHSQLNCVRFPPNATTIPQRGGMVVLTAHPVVQPTDMCYEFRHDPSKPAPTVLGGPAANASGN